MTLPSPSNQSTSRFVLISSKLPNASDMAIELLNVPKSWCTVFAAARIAVLENEVQGR
jgi:hypothetical protein